MNKVTLKEHLNSRIDEVKDSVKTAYDAMDKRLESMNEFREQLKGQASTFVNRDTFDLLRSQVEEMKLVGAKLEGKANQTDVNRNMVIAVIGILIGIISIILKFV